MRAPRRNICTRLIRITAFMAAIYLFFHLLPDFAPERPATFLRKATGDPSPDLCHFSSLGFNEVTQRRSPVVMRMVAQSPPQSGEEVRITVALNRVGGKPIIAADLEERFAEKFHLLIIDPSLRARSRKATASDDATWGWPSCRGSDHDGLRQINFSILIRLSKSLQEDCLYLSLMNHEPASSTNGAPQPPLPFHRRYPDANGMFGEFGGSFIPDALVDQMNKINEAYQRISRSHEFIAELRRIRKHYQGRPTPVYHARNLSDDVGGGQIYFKREDLNHTGAHKLNHCMGEALLAKHLGKTKLIAETGAGQHGVALATAAAFFRLECEIHMGTVDIAKEHPNVIRMKMLGAKVVPVDRGAQTLKEAVDSAFEAYLEDPDKCLYAIGSVVGPHPFPKMVRDFQRVVGIEARDQFLDITGELPENLVACVGGGSNAMGLFSAFIEDPCDLFAVEPMGRGKAEGDHAASLMFGSPGVLHGFRSMLLQNKEGDPAAVYSVASGLDYPSVGPEHAFLKESGRLQAGTADDKEAIDAFYRISRLEGIIPALESAHAIAFAMKLAKERPHQTILVNLSGRGDKDIDFVAEKYGYGDNA